MVSPHQPRVHLPQNQRWARRISRDLLTAALFPRLFMPLCALLWRSAGGWESAERTSSPNTMCIQHMWWRLLTEQEMHFYAAYKQVQAQTYTQAVFLIPDGQCCPTMQCKRKCSQMLKLKDMICEISAWKCLKRLDHCVPCALNLVTSHFGFLGRFREWGRRPRLQLNICRIRFRYYLVLEHCSLSHVRSSFSSVAVVKWCVCHQLVWLHDHLCTHFTHWVFIHPSQITVLYISQKLASKGQVNH